MWPIRIPCLAGSTYFLFFVATQRFIATNLHSDFFFALTLACPSSISSLPLKRRLHGRCQLVSCKHKRDDGLSSERVDKEGSQPKIEDKNPTESDPRVHITPRSVFESSQRALKISPAGMKEAASQLSKIHCLGAWRFYC